MKYYNKVILLVEDETINAILTIRTLEKYGYKVIHVITGEEAVIMMQSVSGIELILMDIDLGDGIDGTEAAEIILSEYDVPLVFLSSHTEPEVVKKTEGITSYGYIVKNSGETVLVASMKMAFRLFDAKKLEEEKERKLQESEERYRSIFENTGTSMFLIESDMTISMVNDEFVNNFGYSKEEVIGRMKWPDLVHPDNLDFMTSQHNLRREDENSAWQTYEIQYMRKSGEVRNGFVSVGMLPGTDKSVASLTDVTALKKTEEALKDRKEELAVMNEEFEETNEELCQTIAQLEEREREYRILFETSSSAICIVADGKLVRHNPAMSEVSGYTGEELVKLPLVSLIHEDDSDTAVLHYMETINKRETGRFELIRIIARDSKVRWISVKSGFILWGGNNATLNFISDVTEHMEAVEALEDAEETFRSLFMNSQVGIFRTEADSGFLIEANDAFARLFGFKDRDDILAYGVRFDEWYADAGIRSLIINILKEKGELSNHEVRFRCKNDSFIWTTFSARFVPEKGWLQGVLIDITERKMAEHELFMYDRGLLKRGDF